MLTIIRDSQGQIQLACEWMPCDDHGYPSNYGRWVWVNQLEMSKTTTPCKIMRQLIRTIAQQMPTAIGAYWRRLDSTGNKIHIYRRGRLMREEVRGYVTA